MGNMSLMHGRRFEDGASLEVGDELVDGCHALEDVAAEGHEAVELSGNVGLAGLFLDDVHNGTLSILAFTVDGAVCSSVVRIHLGSRAVEGSRVECGVARGNVLFEMKHSDHAILSACWSEHCVKRVERRTAMRGDVESSVATVLAESDELELESLFCDDGGEESGQEFFEHGKDATAHVGNEVVVISVGDVVESEMRSLVVCTCTMQVGLGEHLEG